MSRRKRDFLVGEVVFAQVKGTPWWPARVDSVDLDKRTAMVTFYPSKQIARCKMTSAMKDYEQFRAEFGQKKLKGAFVAALAEADEAFLTAPKHPQGGKQEPKSVKRKPEPKAAKPQKKTKVEAKVAASESGDESDEEKEAAKKKANVEEKESKEESEGEEKEGEPPQAKEEAGEEPTQAKEKAGEEPAHDTPKASIVDKELHEPAPAVSGVEE